ncbi:MAG TPA: FAD synthetase family protein, partial [Pseudogracilibacillus sp.]|nr:FAD synthetase family protein [Pseudogracilibacillus sp.]
METYFINHKKRNRFQINSSPSVMALGFFDGVHLGHIKVIKTAVRIARKRGLKSVVMTFTPHPREVIGEKEKVSMLTTFSEKEALIRELGVDDLYVVQFDPTFSALTPGQFVKEYVTRFKVQHVVAGFDFKYGAHGKGNMEKIVKYGRHTFTATTVPVKKVKDEIISSTLIRNMVSSGQIEQVKHYLGRNYKTVGRIAPLPRRNICRIRINEQFVFPKTGKYVVFIHSSQTTRKAIVTCNKEKNDIWLGSKSGTPYFISNHLVTIE